MKRILINATQEEETRVALVDGQRLYDFDIEISSRAQIKSNIYKGIVGRVEPSLEAVFVNFGNERHGFLPLKEISKEYFKADQSANIKELIHEGQEIVVQVVKEERGNKGAALTTFLSLAGRFLVLMPNSPGAGGISRRISPEDRKQLQKTLKAISLDKSMSYIVRTAGVGRSAEELQWDLDYLSSIWESIKMAAVKNPGPALIYREGNSVIRAIRDHLNADIGEVIIDNPQRHEELIAFIDKVMPHNLNKIKLHDDPQTTLFSRYQIESQIESAYAHQVNLPSGGSMVIDHTEALISIDINSSRSTKGDDIETTALNTNLEAAQEIARQLRIRDIGGLIVIDFIDMSSFKNQREVENKLKSALEDDKARIQVGKISRFGLLEMSRQRLKPALEDSTQLTCPRCSGLGQIRSLESITLSILRRIGEESRKDNTGKVLVFVPLEVSDYILNQKRDVLNKIESNNLISVVLLTNPKLQTPAYEIIRVRKDEISKVDDLIKESLEREVGKRPALNQVSPSVSREPLVENILPNTPPPKPKQPGLLTALIRWFSSLFSSKKKKNYRNQKGRYNRRRRNNSRPSNRGESQSSKPRNRNRSRNRNRNRNQNKINRKPRD